MCQGTGLILSSIEESGQIMGHVSFPVVDGEIVSASNEQAIIQWQNNTFVVEIVNGTVSFTGPVTYLPPIKGHGVGKCDQYGPWTSQGRST